MKLNQASIVAKAKAGWAFTYASLSGEICRGAVERHHGLLWLRLSRSEPRRIPVVIMSTAELETFFMGIADTIKLEGS